MGRTPRAYRAALTLALVSAPHPALAQRTTENAVTASDDAFGTTIGLETTGIYTDTDTRGFSPVKAGNARIDGIYYDPVGLLPTRLRQSTAIRVGFSAGSFPFQAPTGIADYRFRSFPAEWGASLAFNRTAFDGTIMEVDLRLPIVKDHISLTGGGADARQALSDGSRKSTRGGSIRPIIRYGGIEFSPYIAPGRYISNYTHPLVVVTDYLPAFPRKRRFLGQRWASGRYDNVHKGATLKAAITNALSLRAGIFNSRADRDEYYSEIFSIVAPSGLAVHRLISDPHQRQRSTSGEAQVALRLVQGRIQHRFIAGFRARDRLIDSGGSDIRNFGQVAYGQPNPQLEPSSFSYAPVNVGRVKQSFLLLGYVGRIEGIALLNLGVQKTRYRATLRDGRTGIDSRSRASPLLYNASLGIDVSKSLSFYLGSERGLEDSGAAPENAANRNAQLPAARSTQYEGGVRWKFRGGQLVVSGFQITKPYFSFDAGNAFTQAGNVRHRGVEASLSGQFGPRLNLVAGAVALQARVTGPARDLGLVGERPAGTPALYARVDANYRTDIFGGLTPTASLTYTGRRAVSSRPLPSLGGRQLMLPGAAIVDLGLRHHFIFGGTPVSFRALVNNIFDKATWKVVAPNTIYPDERRRFTLTMVADF